MFVLRIDFHVPVVDDVFLRVWTSSVLCLFESGLYRWYDVSSRVVVVDGSFTCRCYEIGLVPVLVLWLLQEPGLMLL